MWINSGDSFAIRNEEDVRDPRKIHVLLLKISLLLLVLGQTK